jgi:hypothetical protein
MGSVSNKLYKCSVCDHEYKTSTNHYGSHTGKCPSCRSSCRKICMEPEAIELREKVQTVDAWLYAYNFDISNSEEAAKYTEMENELNSRGMRCFNTYHESISLSKSQSVQGGIKLDSSTIFSDQWNEHEHGLRLHDWFEGIYVNVNIKKGYYLELSAEAKKCREGMGYCHYCGHRDTVSNFEEQKGCSECKRTGYIFDLNQSGLVKVEAEWNIIDE